MLLVEARRRGRILNEYNAHLPGGEKYDYDAPYWYWVGPMGTPIKRDRSFVLSGLETLLRVGHKLKIVKGDEYFKC
jgi:hypothetical protein